MSSRWTYSSRNENGQEQALRNTSLASRTAPALAPCIIAPATATTTSTAASAFARPSSRLSRPLNPSVALSSEEEFPTMGATRSATAATATATAAATATAWGGAKPSFATLARDWASHQQKEAEEARLEAERAQAIARERQAQKEKDDKERRALQHLTLGVGLRRQERTEEDAKYDIGGTRELDLGDEDSLPSDHDGADEGDDDVIDDAWERSRNKYDYY